MEYLWAWGTLIHEKTWARKSRVRLSLRKNFNASSLFQSTDIYDSDGCYDRERYLQEGDKYSTYLQVRDKYSTYLQEGDKYSILAGERQAQHIIAGGRQVQHILAGGRQAQHILAGETSTAHTCRRDKYSNTCKWKTSTTILAGGKQV